MFTVIELVSGTEHKAAVLEKNSQTRMHSSKMPTVRCSGRLLEGEVSARDGVCPRECLPSLSRGVSAQGGICLVCPGECLPGDVYLVCPVGCLPSLPGEFPPLTEFLAHAYENITFLQLCGS